MKIQHKSAKFHEYSHCTLLSLWGEGPPREGGRGEMSKGCDGGTAEMSEGGWGGGLQKCQRGGGEGVAWEAGGARKKKLQAYASAADLSLLGEWQLGELRPELWSLLET